MSICACAGLVAVHVLLLGQPRAHVPVEQVDLGVQLAHQILGHQFTIQNTGTETLVLLVSKRSCRVRLAMSRDKVEPGGSITVGLFGEATHYSGPYNIYGVLATNDPLMPEIILSLKATLVQEVEATPARLDIDSTAEGGAAARGGAEHVYDLVVTCCGNDPEQRACVCGAATSSPELSLQELGVRESELCTAYTYRVGLQMPEVRSAEFSGQVVIHTTSGRVPRLEIPVRARARALAVCTPKTILVSLDDDNPVFTALVRVRVSDGQLVERADCPDSRVSVSVVDGEAAGEQCIKIVAAPNGKAGEINSAVTLYGREQTVLGTVPIIGFVGGKR